MPILPSVPLATLLPRAILESLFEYRIVPTGADGLRLLAVCAHANTKAIAHFLSGATQPRQPFCRIVRRIRNNPEWRREIASHPQLLRRMIIAELLYDAERNLRDLRIAGVIEATPEDVSQWEAPAPRLTREENLKRRAEANRRWRANKKKRSAGHSPQLQVVEESDNPPPAA